MTLLAIGIALAACAAHRPGPGAAVVASGEVLSVTFPAADAPTADPLAAETSPGADPPAPAGEDDLPACTAAPDAPLRAVGVAGALSLEAVHAAVVADLSAVRICVQDALSEAPHQPGQVLVRLSVAPEGRVSRSTVAGDTTGDDGHLAACLARALARVPFPPADGPTWVCWPVNVQVR